MALSLNRLSASVRIWTEKWEKYGCDKLAKGLNRLSASVRIWTDMGHREGDEVLRRVLIAFRLLSEFGLTMTHDYLTEKQIIGLNRLSI